MEIYMSKTIFITGANLNEPGTKEITYEEAQELLLASIQKNIYI